MPLNSQWYRDIPTIRVLVEAVETPDIDRTMAETIFGVERRQAARILSRIAPAKERKHHRVPKEAVLAWLTRLEAGEEFANLTHRRRRLREALLEAHSIIQARKVKFRAKPSPTARPTVRNLPAGVEIQPGELRVRFDEPIEMLEKMKDVLEAVARDFVTFEAIARRGHHADAERLRMGVARR